MKRLLCLLLLGSHDWRAHKWGLESMLDCRTCCRCDRFQIWAYGSFHTVPVAEFLGKFR